MEFNRRSLWVAGALVLVGAASTLVTSLIFGEVEPESPAMRIPPDLTPRVVSEATETSSSPALAAPPLRPEDEPANPEKSWPGERRTRPPRLVDRTPKNDVEEVAPDSSRPTPEVKRLIVVARDSRTGKPVNGALVTLGQGSRPAVSGLTRAQGSVALGPFDDDSGSITGTVWHPRYDGTNAIKADIAKKARASVILQSRGRGEVVGMIRGTSTPAPTRVTLRVRNGEAVAEIGASDFDSYDASGSFRCDLTPGRYTIQATAPGYEASPWSRPVDVNLGAPAQVDFALKPEARIEGTAPLGDLAPMGVDRAETLDLLMDVSAGTDPQGPFDVRTATLEPNGRFSLGELGSGTFLVRLHGSGEWTTVCVLSGSRTHGVDLSPPFETAGHEAPWSSGRDSVVKIKLSGIVRDAGGEPVAGALVRAGLHNEPTATDANGRWTATVSTTEPRCVVLVSKKGFRTHAILCDLRHGGVPLEITLATMSH